MTMTSSGFGHKMNIYFETVIDVHTMLLFMYLNFILTIIMSQFVMKRIDRENYNSNIPAV